MEALAGVGRRFRGKQDGLLVGYAPLTENLYAALAEYPANDQNTKPLGRDLDAALAKVRDLHDTIGNIILAGYDWRAKRAEKSPKAFINAVLGTVNYLRDPPPPATHGEDPHPPLPAIFRHNSP